MQCGNLEEINKYDLSSFDLSGFDLSNLNLSRIDLFNSNLSYANLYSSNLNGSDLSDTILYRANLAYTNLSSASLAGANLAGANLTGVDLTDAEYDKNTILFALQCPEEVEFIGYKAAKNKIVKLKITENAKRSSATSRKYRCSEAEVISIDNIDGTDAAVDSVQSDWDSEFVYRVGETVRVDDFNEDRWEECSSGIHFFITRKEVVDYILHTKLYTKLYGENIKSNKEKGW